MHGRRQALLLGDTFLRNAYTLYNLNIGNDSQAEIGPYVQMLSVSVHVLRRETCGVTHGYAIDN